ncbi:GDSL esterase/lipase At2g03980 [Hevea brasiliensis]|uniref:GDSL esterase/lipase At2g03980 n=1 Tax=Hevea brasiliensis TaxID=3981 RepID=UPI0025F78B14|nr:GDSL esterase/lipase At2g03980 [Hevea brasiliensis]
MGKALMLCFVLFIYSRQLFYVSAENSWLVPALYIFGDSTVDPGNNNNLPTRAKANFLPYGIDFNNTPTGRFTNGMTIADCIAMFLGLPFPPAYMNLSETKRSKITTGLNYGSSSCGILPETGSSEGSCLTLDKQIDLFKSTANNDMLRENLEMHLAKSIFFISIGPNDYTLNYFKNSSDISKLFLPDEFAKFLINELAKRLQKLYELGARKFLLNGIGPLGCTPGMTNSIQHKGECVEFINKVVNLYNVELSTKLLELQSHLPGSLFIHSDNFKHFQELKENPETYGITNMNSTCWIPNQSLCLARDKYLFFDAFHTSQGANMIYARRCFNETSICNPLNIMQLVSA